MKKIGILGGTFDPPHNGHLLIAYEVLHALSLDEIWFMPAQIPPHKEAGNVTKSTDRLRMVKLAIDGHIHFHVQPIELERQGPSYSLDTVKLLKEKYKKYDFYFIIGGDMIEYLPKWYKIEELLSLLTFVGVGRTGFSHHTKYPIISLDTPLFDISSTFIRNRLRENGNTEQLLPPSVRIYIEENHLYE
ncbi:nicotinate-nucleotide adenylyltransferase [Bacillus sp. DJP31]|uniref:nicotinate-nucleotide adenylyltransferase n=1 Tax=Bacillus sp. DJP31 TaxID=3409789 RepID=UPI003BB74784